VRSRCRCAKSRGTVPAHPVDATPSALNLFPKCGVCDARETGETFREAADRHVALEGGAVVARDWTSLWQGPRIHSVYVVAARRDCSAAHWCSLLMLTLAEREDISRRIASGWSIREIAKGWSGRCRRLAARWRAMAGDLSIEPMKPISRPGSRPCDPSSACWPSTRS